MIDFLKQDRYGVYDLERIIAYLRSPDGCPWDREQTHSSIRRNVIEEAYETAAAIDSGDAGELLEELGDLLMQVVFHTSIEQEAGGFSLDDVADKVCRKLIYRHPHVFGDISVSGADEVLRNWDELKRLEKKQATVGESLRSIPSSMPALMRAEKLQSRASKAGCDLLNPQEALNAAQEELGLLFSGSGGENTFGRLYFYAVCAARLSGVDIERALSASCDSFIGSFEEAEAAGTKPEGASIYLSLRDIRHDTKKEKKNY